MENAIAVLARTNRSLRSYEETFSRNRVRYFLLGRSGFWSQQEIRSVMAYLQLAVLPTDPAVVGALVSPFHPSRYHQLAPQ